MMFNELREKVENQEHSMALFQTQVEGRYVKMKTSRILKFIGMKYFVYAS